MQEKEPQRNKQGWPSDDAAAKELSRINREGAADALRAADRLQNLINARSVVDEFLGEGLAYNMPLNEAISFLYEHSEKLYREREASASAQDIKNAVNTLSEQIGKQTKSGTIFSKDPLGKVLDYMNDQEHYLSEHAEAVIKDR